jgi:hypothetical protein
MRWIIGDIHGMATALDGLITLIEREDRSPHFIFIGDYVNRGPGSPQVIDRVLSLSRATCLRGNHDDIFDLVLHGECYSCNQNAPDSISAFGWFMQHGLAETLMAYGADFAELEHLQLHPNADKLAKLLTIVPERHRQFIHDLPAVLEHPDIFVSHAMWDVDTSDSTPDIGSQLRSDARLRHQILWGRFSGEQIQRTKRWKRTGYFGHTPVVNYLDSDDFVPLDGSQIVLLDTAVALHPLGRLSAVCADTRQILQTDRGGEKIG